MQWYYSIDGQRLGPVSQAEFETLVTNGVVKAETLVWRQGMAEWLPHQKVNGTTAVTSVGAAAGAAVATAATVANDSDTEVCVVSGKRHPRHEMLNYEGRWISAERRDEFFQRQREGVAQPGDIGVPGPFGYAGLWPRFVAAFLDGLITGVVSMIAGMIVGFLIGALVGVGQTQVILIQVISQLIGMAIGISYHVYFTRKQDATPGKQAMGLKLLRADGSKLTVGRIIGRYFSHFINAFTLGIGYLMAAFDDQKRGLHDRICDTRVIKTR